MKSVTGPSCPFPMNTHLSRTHPWVSVICISYNHEAYVEEALRSVVGQNYPNVELIVIDNGSRDRSAERIARFVRQHPAVLFLQNPVNRGLNQAFNQGLATAGGRYIIDLSADDVLLPDRIARQAEQFERLPGSCGVVFSNAAYIDGHGRKIGVHYPVDARGRAIASVPSGNVFRSVLASYFICTPTMMMRRDVLNELGGYDETLSYEDFDFWVRSSRLYHYAYLDEILTLKRQLPGSLSAQVVRTDNRLLHSTLAVCEKAFVCCQTPDEYSALAGRVRTFVRKAFYAEQFGLVRAFGKLLRRIEKPGLPTSLILTLSHLHLPVNRFYRQYLRYRHHHRSSRRWVKSNGP